MKCVNFMKDIGINMEWPMHEPNSIDLYRLDVVNRLTREQKDFFLLGLGLYSACCTKDQLALGQYLQSEGDVDTLKRVEKTLKKYDLPLYREDLEL